MADNLMQAAQPPDGQAVPSNGSIPKPKARNREQPDAHEGAHAPEGSHHGGEPYPAQAGPSRLHELLTPSQAQALGVKLSSTASFSPYPSQPTPKIPGPVVETMMHAYSQAWNNFKSGIMRSLAILWTFTLPPVLPLQLLIMADPTLHQLAGLQVKSCPS